MITKKQAHLLAAHGYKLVDKEGNEFEITAVMHTGRLRITFGENDRDYIDPSEIGKSFWIACLPQEALTKEIDEKTPIVELAKIAWPDEDFELNGNVAGCMNFDFGFIDGNFAANGYAYRPKFIPNQQDIFDTLYDMHFPPYGIGPENLKYKTI